METTKKIQGGDVRAASRLIRNLEDRIPGAKTTIKHLFPFTGKAHVIGITGSPGAGKSTLTDGLIECIRKKGKTVGVLAVDPTSPLRVGRSSVTASACRGMPRIRVCSSGAWQHVGLSAGLPRPLVMPFIFSM